MIDIRDFLDEDVGDGDITTDIFVRDRPGTAAIVCEDDAVVAGLEEAHEIFGLLGVHLERKVKDGSHVTKGTAVAEISGNVKGILTAERTALNMMMRMSGIATMTYNVIKECAKINKNIMIAGTRKTTPGFRKYEKKAIELGGGWSHRHGLYDAVLIKDNHIEAAGGVENAMQLVRKVPKGITVEVEVENLDDAVAAAKHRPDMIMIDNRTPETTAEIYRKIKSIDPNIKVEVSGRITPENAKEYAGSCDIISIGALTHSVKAIHFSLRLD